MTSLGSVTRFVVDLRAADFGRAWQAGPTPRIEDYLDGVAEPQRSYLLAELLRVEREYREALGEIPKPQEYRSRFPGHEAVVDGIFGVTPSDVHDGNRQQAPGTKDCGAPGDGAEQMGRSDVGASSTLAWMSRTDNQPDGGCVSFFLGSQRRVEPASSTASAIPSASCFLNDEWGIARYAPIRKLGEGAFGVVFPANDRELNRRVALKLPKRPRLASEQDAIDFLFEARTLATLDHPGIVPVYDVGRADDGRCYVVSKYIRGEDLRQRLKRRSRLGQQEAARLVRQVALALHHAHEAGLVHRDIKPANILLSERDEPYLTDFGLALKTEDLQLGSQVAGTPAYMSPEQINGDVSQLDGRSDIFTLGVVFYELLTGERPFRGKSLADLLAEICSSDPQSLDHPRLSVSRALNAICLKCLAKEPADRYQTGKQLADELHRWLTDEEMPETEAKSPPVRRPTFAFVTAMALGVLLSGVALTIWIRSNPRAPVEAAKIPPIIIKQSGPPPPPKVVVQYVRVPAGSKDDPPPMGYSPETWASLPEVMKIQLRRFDPLSPRGPGDRFNNHLPFGRDAMLLDPLGRLRRPPTGVDSSLPGFRRGR